MSQPYFQKELNGGILALIVLAQLEASNSDLYGYELAKQLNQVSEGDLCFKDESIYAVLRSLAKRRLLSSRIVPSYGRPARRYYRITPEGRDALAQWRRAWCETRDLTDRLLQSVAS